MIDTKTHILDVSENLIRRVGLNAMSYKDISDKVGIRKASIHHHFAKKENLVDALLERCHSDYGRYYRTIVEQEATAPAKLRQFSGVFEEGLKSGRLCLVGSLGSVVNTLQPNTQNILETTIQQTIDIISDVFSQGRREGSLSLHGSDEEVAKAFFSLLVGAQISCRSIGGTASFHQVIESLIRSWENI